MASWLQADDVAAAKADEWLNQAKTKTQAWLTSFTGAASPMPDQQPAVPEPAPAMPQIKLPTAEELRALAPWRDLDPQPSPAQTPATLVDGRQQVQPGLRPGEQMGSVSITQGADDGIADVSPDEPVSSETVTRAAAAALKKAGLSPEMAPYIAGIAINEGILQPGTIARDNWSVGGVKADGTAGSVTVPTREVIDGQSVMQTASFGAFNTMQEGMDALAAFVRDSPRFGPVVRQAMQTGDYSNLIAGFKEGGYATDPNWVQQVTSIASGLTAPVQGPRPTTPPQAEQTPMAQAQYDPSNLVPNQITESTNAGLDWDTALATCGVAAAVAFARANGRTPTWQEAMQLAEASGWNKDVGMSRGTAGQVELLGRLGVKARAAGLDENQIAATVQAGQPVIVNAHGNGGHFYVATQYDPSTRKFNFGNSAAVLKRSGGQTWFRLDELPSLGVGTPSEAIYMGAN